jgi:hypothetical protein
VRETLSRWAITPSPSNAGRDQQIDQSPLPSKWRLAPFLHGPCFFACHLESENRGQSNQDSQQGSPQWRAVKGDWRPIQQHSKKGGRIPTVGVSFTSWCKLHQLV